MSRFARSAWCIGVLAWAGCFSAELDPTQSGVFVCDVDGDCALGQACLDGVCTQTAGTEGPALRIVAPLQLEVFAAGGPASLAPVISLAGIELTGEPSHDAAAGYVEVQLDGAVIDSVVEGDISVEIELAEVPMPTDPGLHHLRILALRPDGRPFPGAQAQASVGFWVDDGRAHIGILEPPPGARLVQGEDIRVEVASLNFTFVNPGFVAPDEADASAQGYANLYVDRAIPGCLPGCNGEYEATLVPAGLSRVNRIVAEPPVRLAAGLGITHLQVVGQSLAHAPYIDDGEPPRPLFAAAAVQMVAPQGDR